MVDALVQLVHIGGSSWSLADYAVVAALALLVGMAAVLVSLSVRLRRKSRVLDHVINRYSLVHQSLDDFMALATANLPIAVTSISEALERVNTLGLTDLEYLQELARQSSELKKFSGEVVGDNQNSAVRSDTKDQILVGDKPKAWRSPLVWAVMLPVTAGLVACNLLATPYLHIQPWIQLVGYVVGSLGVILSYRHYARTRSLRQKVEKQAASRVSLFNTRREFVIDTGHRLEDIHNNFVTSSQRLASVPQAREFFNGLRILARISRGIMSVHRATDMDTATPLFAVSTALQKRADQIYQPEIKKRHMEFRTKIDPGLAFHIQPKDLEQLVNLTVENAVTYSKPGARILLRGYRRGDKVIIAIADTGVGISKPTLDFLFRPLQHTGSTDATQSAEHQPTKVSLGLQICKLILTRIGGELRITTKPGKGTTVFLIAPRKHTDIPLVIPRHISSTSSQLSR